MRLRLSAFALAFAALLCSAFVWRKEHAATLPGDCFAHVQSVIVEDDWQGAGEITSRTIHGHFWRQSGAWNGDVYLSVICPQWINRRKRDVSCHKTVAAAVPDAVMQKVLAVLQTVPLQRQPYEAVQTHAGNCPCPVLIVRSPERVVVFTSESNTPHNTPWAVHKDCGEFVTTSDAPYTALLLLRPYLHEKQLETLKIRADHLH